MQNVFDSIYYLGAELATLWNLGGTNVRKTQRSLGSRVQCNAKHCARRRQAGSWCVCANRRCEPGKKKTCQHIARRSDPAASDAPIVRDVRLARAPACQKNHRPTRRALGTRPRQASWATCAARKLFCTCRLHRSAWMSKFRWSLGVNHMLVSQIAGCGATATNPLLTMCT